MTSSESEGQPPPRKRSRTGQGGQGGDENGSKKARGRPRVDTQDATAADRRRTQIRLAQRAYRQRKETTISSLKQQNTTLQTIIEQMNKSFLRFNDSALRSGVLQVNPGLGRELKQVTETFVNLAKQAAAEGSSDGDDDGMSLDPAAELHKATENARASREGQPVHATVGWGYSATLEDSPPPRSASTPHEEILQHSTYFPPMPNSLFEAAKQSSLIRSRARPALFDQQGTRPSSSMAQAMSLPFGMVDITPQYGSDPTPGYPRIFSAAIPTPEVTPPTTRLSTPPLLPSLSLKTPKTTWTYSHDETTFARRLTRAALEAGFHLLSTANLRPAALNYVFKLSLPYMSLDGLRERFRLLLARGIHEDLDCWETPFIHLGGAGTHYPRKDSQGNLVHIPNSWTVRSIGPQKMIRAENTKDPSRSHDLSIDLAGFDGEWFDAYDVQGYLEHEKGCHINPKDSFAEVIIEVEEETNAELPAFGSLSYSRNLNLDFSTLRQASPSNESPALSNGSSSTDSTSNQSTPPTTTTSDPMGVSQSEAPFALDMAMGSFPDFNTKFNDIDTSSFFDLPLGLDLAPAYGTDMPTTLSGFSSGAFGDMESLGLDMMGEGLQVVRQKKKKAAWIDVSKFIDEVIKHGVCLGRAPGFRRKDIDQAFHSALVHAY
ncbi:hypothetical protein P154DRAFT_222374 [Amniculicola lignicola CBS 123094]|uniref:BZIP domain-containing protein n=1 Tax=Amniculicola lignicola CBS 123094 TaxID=1392246 RepID=A0A6A5WY51_9PLEO|nr:hypothetical protein P154DRAFT_222374 [Amniculicola lignicola CBS 123094]